MSFKSWEKEFYPVSAKTLAESKASDIELLEHSLQKWRGALPENLEKHGMTYADHSLKEKGKRETFFVFSGNSCTLCVRHVTHTVTGLSCGTCPIVRHTGGSCDGDAYIHCDNGPGERHFSNRIPNVYEQSNNTAEPMVQLLEEILEKEKAGKLCSNMKEGHNEL